MSSSTLRPARALLAALAVAACGGDGATAPGDDIVPAPVLARIDAASTRYPRDIGAAIGTISSLTIRQAGRLGVRPAPVPAMGPGWSGLVMEDESRRATQTFNGTTIPSDTLHLLHVLLWNEAGAVMIGTTVRSARAVTGLAPVAMLINLDAGNRVWMGRSPSIEVTERVVGGACAGPSRAPIIPECALGRWTMTLAARGFDPLGDAPRSDAPFERRNVTAEGVRRVIDLTRGP